jgi:hypothetical protein
MSVPLDRLYNFLHDISDRALFIYLWNPHGSKKLADLLGLLPSVNPHWRDRTSPVIICHDQEPLFYDLYTEADIRDRMLSIFADTPENDIIERLWIQSLIDFLSKMHLRGLVYLDRMGMYDKIMILHSEKRSQQLQIYEENEYVGIYYWSHAMISADWFRYAQHDSKLIFNFDQIRYDFLIYNRAWTGTREYRLTFMHELINRDLQKNCLTSFSSHDDGFNYLDHKFKNSTLAVDLQGLADHFPINTYDSTASADYNNDDYSCTAIEVVLETLFDDTRLHLTEKTLRPIACGRPFMLMATYGSLQYLRDYGFRTFDGIIDETYDTITDPRKRLNAVVQEMVRISSLNSSEKYILWKQLYDIAKFNQRLFFSEDWQQSISQEFLTNLYRAIGVLNQHKNKVIQNKMDQIWDKVLESTSL